MWFPSGIETAAAPAPTTNATAPMTNALAISTSAAAGARGQRRVDQPSAVLGGDEHRAEHDQHDQADEHARERVPVGVAGGDQGAMSPDPAIMKPEPERSRADGAQVGIDPLSPTSCGVQAPRDHPP